MEQRKPVGLYCIREVENVYRLLVERTSRYSAGRFSDDPPVTKNLRLTEDLLPDERMLWVGKPVRWWLFGLNDILALPFLVPVGAVLLAFGTAWIVIGPKLLWIQTAGFAWLIPLIQLYGLVAIISGLYALVGRFPHLYVQKQRTEYAITNRRILGFSNGQVWSMPLCRLPVFSLRKRWTNIIFEPNLLKPLPRDGRLHINLLPGDAIPGFFGIRHAREVEELIHLAVRMQPPPSVPQ